MKRRESLKYISAMFSGLFVAVMTKSKIPQNKIPRGFKPVKAGSVANADDFYH